MKATVELIKNKIAAYDRLIIVTHRWPDYDAIGSQIGLYLALKKAYPGKEIYMIGETIKGWHEADYTADDPKLYDGAMVIFTDTAAKKLVGTPHYDQAAYTFCFDHHKSRGQFTEDEYIDTTSISAAQIIYQFIEEMGIELDGEIAEVLLAGIITDSGRFRYQLTSSTTLLIAAKLLETGIDLEAIYQRIYGQQLEKVRYEGMVKSNFKVFHDQIAYMIHTKEMVDNSGLEFKAITSGMINSMAEIDGIEAWMSFTETDEGIYTEFRSKNYPVVSVAKALGGGGHDLACGCTIQSLDQVEEVLSMLEKVLLEQQAQ